MKKTRKALLWSLGLLFAGFYPALLAAAPQIDTSFGDSGVEITDFGLGDDVAYDLAVQPDGKIIAVGFNSNGVVKNLAVARYLADGTPDPDFNNDGLYTASLGIGDTVGRSVELLADGRIIVAGGVDDGEQNLVIIRLTSDGFLDIGFGGDGSVRLSTGETPVTSTDLVTTTDGTLYVAGTAVKDEQPGYAVVAKILADGQLATDFGTDGVAEIRREDGLEINSIGLLEGGRIVAGGSLITVNGAQPGLLALAATGTLDPSFGSEGFRLLTEDEAVGTVYDLKVTAAGSIYAAGELGDATSKTTMIAKVGSNGSLDTGFGTQGLFLSPVAEENSGHALAVQDDGLVLVAGVAVTDSGKDLFLLTMTDAQSDTAGPDTPSADESLTDNDGVTLTEAQSSTGSTTKNTAPSYTVTDVAHKDDIGNAIVVMGDGRILAAGSTDNGSNEDFAVFRYLAAQTTEESTTVTTEDGTGVATSGYLIITSPISAITRVSAVTGGEIFDYQELSCETSCTAQCESEEDDGDGNVDDDDNADDDDTTCYDECLDACQNKPTIEMRGVVFGITTLPVYEADEDETDDSDTSDTTDGGDDVSIFPPGGDNNYDIVRSGQTDDGSGTGSYSSEIMDITPQTTYYVRAYAVLSDDTVIYGNELSFTTSDACFIATAAYGSMLAMPVRVLRDFRDIFLKATPLGERLIGIYYAHSPPLARIVAEHPGMRAMVRGLLLPLVIYSFIMLHLGQILATMALLLGVSIIVLLHRRYQRLCKENS